MNDISATHDASTSIADLSRRRFLELSAGACACAILGVFAEGNAVKVAYADENGDFKFSIYILSAEEVPILALEPLPAGGFKGVEGVTVELRNDKGAVSAGPTDANGFAPVNIRSLADDSRAERNIYYCYASVKAAKDGYRSFEEYEMLVSGIHADETGRMHNVLRIPTQTDDGKTPYLSEMSLDGQDLQYNTRDVFVHANNDLAHVVTLTLRNAGTARWGFAFNVNGESIGAIEDVAAENGVATVDLKGPWLRAGAGGIAPGDKLSVSYRPMGGAKTTILSDAAVKQADLAFPDGYDRGHEFAIGGSTRKKGDKTVKDSVKIDQWMKKQSFDWNIKLPFLPVEFFCDTDENIGASASLPGLYLFKVRNGKSEIKEFKDRWKPLLPKTCVKSFAEQCRDEWKRLGTMVENGLNSLDTEKELTICEQGDFLDFALDLQLRGFGKRFAGYVAGTMDEDDAMEPALDADGSDDGSPGRTIQMQMGLSAQLEAKITFSFPFTIGWIPMYWGWDLGGSFIVQYRGNLRFEGFFRNSRWYVDEGTPAAVFSLSFEAGIFWGLGAKDFISVSFRGYGYLRTMVGILPKGKPVKAAVYVGAGVVVSCVLVFFTKNLTLCETKPQVLLGTGNGGDGSEDPDYALPGYTTVFKETEYESLPVVELDEFTGISTDDLEILTEADLAPCTEFACELNAAGEEGCYIDGVWTPAAVQMREGFVQNEVPEEGAALSDPYDPPEGGSAYNPARGVRAESVLMNATIFGDPRYRFVAANSMASFMYRIGVAEIRVRTEANPDGFEVVNVEEDGRTFPYVLSGEAVRAEDEEAARIYAKLGAGAAADGPSVTASDAASVVRGRVVYSYADKQVPWCFETALQLKGIPDRVNTWDTDFDVVSFNDTRFVLVCSTRRPYDEEKTFDAVFDTQFLTLAELPGGSEFRSTAYGWDDNGTVVRWLPRLHAALTDVADKDEKSYEAACYFYQRGKAEAESATVIGKAVLTHAGDAEPEWKTGGVVEVPSEMAGMVAQGNLQVLGIRTDVKDAYAYRPVFKAGEGQVRLLAWSVSKTADHEAFSVFWIEGRPTERVVLKNVASVAPMAPEYGSHAIRYIVARNFAQGERKQVLAVEVFANADDPGIGIRSVMNESAVVSFRSVADNAAGRKMVYGSALTAVRTMDGQAPPLPKFAEDARAEGAELCTNTSSFASPHAGLDETVDKEGKVEFYQLLRADWNHEAARFTDFYPIAQLDHCPDDITEMGNYYYATKGYSTYISASKFKLTDVGAGMYFTSIPTGVGIRLKGIEALSLFCMAGDVCPVKVTVTGTGTQKLRGFRVTIRGGGKSSSVWLTELGNHVEESLGNYVEVLDAEGNPTGERELRPMTNWEKKYLWPGQTRTYLARPRIPLGLQGRVEFTVSVDGPLRPGEMPPASAEGEWEDASAASASSVAEGETVVSAADFGDYLYAQELADEANRALAGLEADAKQADGQADDPDFRWADPQTCGFTIEAGDGQADAEGLHRSIIEDESGGTGTRVAGTGDGTGSSALGAVALGAAAAATAGIAAYERRRAENEGLALR